METLTHSGQGRRAWQGVHAWTWCCCEQDNDKDPRWCWRVTF